MPQQAMERNIIMGNVLSKISTHGYKYNLTKGFSMWQTLPPPRGTEINCQAAANLAKRLAEEEFDLEGNALKVISVKPKGGFIVLAGTGMKALGTTNPEVISGNLKCWEFDNHFRVQDPKGFNKVYDPIFGSSGNLNPQGIQASSEMVFEKKGGVMCQVTEYGEKYRVTRSLGKHNGIEEFDKKPVNPKYYITDADFK